MHLCSMNKLGWNITTCRYVTRLKLLQDPLLTLSGQSLTLLNFFQDPDVTFGSIATSLALLKSLPKYLALSYAASPTLSQSNLIHASSLARNIPKFCSVILLFASVIATLLKLYNANSSVYVWSGVRRSLWVIKRLWPIILDSFV